MPKQFFPTFLRNISILSILKWCSAKMVILNLHGEYLLYLMQCILNSSSVFLRIRALENVKIQTARITTHEPVVDQRRYIAVNPVRCLWRNAWNVIENGKPRTKNQNCKSDIFPPFSLYPVYLLCYDIFKQSILICFTHLSFLVGITYEYREL